MLNDIHTGMARIMVQVNTYDYLQKVQFIPKGELTPHPQCFSGHDDLKTDEDYPINAYRAFYKRDKVSFARWNKNRVKPDWFMDA